MQKLPVLLLLWSSLLMPVFSQAQATPNIVVFFIDDLGWTDLGCYGSDLYETPHIDQLAAEGVKFTDAYSACTVCSPSRAAMMSGKYPARLHLTDWIEGHKRPEAPLLPPDWTMYLAHEETTLPEYLKTAGYTSAHIGKWHLGEDSTFWPQYQGFDLNVAGYKKGQPPSFFFPYQRKNGPPIPYLPGGEPGEYLTYRLTKEAMHFVRTQAESETPFFLYYAHYAVHTPLQAPDSLIGYYEEKVDSSARHINATYAAMIHTVDQSVGALRSELEATGQWDNTLVIFASDNGGLIGWPHKKVTTNYPLRAGKGSAYEGGVRTPLIIRYPGNTGAGTESDQPVITMDLFSTVLDAAGLPFTDKSIDGLSLMDVKLTPAAFDSERKLYWHYPHYHTQGATPYSAIRSGRYKLLEFYEDGHLELYDLENDLGETENLVETEPKLTRKLHKQLKKWRKKVSAQDPLVNPNAVQE